MRRIFCITILLAVFSTVSVAQNQKWNKHYYMMNTGDTRELPAGKYVSSDEKVVAVKNSRIQALANGDCIIHVDTDNGRTEFAHVTVGWPVQNPVLPYSWKMYVPDSEVHNFGGKLYAYGSLDDSELFCSPYYISLMTGDLKRWESHGASFSSYDRDTPYPGRCLWDSDGHYYNGKYFLYGFFELNFSAENYTFVLESDNPMGPFKNFRWVRGDQSKRNIDGTATEIFTDDDGSRYTLNFPTIQPVENSYPVIARLIDDDLIDESSIKNLGPYIQDFYEAPSMRKRGDTYYFIYAENCGRITDENHTPKRLSYATAKDIFGEYTYRGPIITVEQLANNVNIQGSIEQFNGEWYIFYHRVVNGVWNKRSLCVEKIEFDRDGLIIPVVPTSSGASGGLDTSLPVWFNTAVYGCNYSFTDEGKYGHTLINGAAEVGFRYIAFTGREKQLTLQGSGLENIVYVKVVANGRIIGEGKDANAIRLQKVSKGKAELTLFITTTGDVRLEMFRF